MYEISYQPSRRINYLQQQQILSRRQTIWNLVWMVWIKHSVNSVKFNSYKWNGISIIIPFMQNVLRIVACVCVWERDMWTFRARISKTVLARNFFEHRIKWDRKWMKWIGLCEIYLFFCWISGPIMNVVWVFLVHLMVCVFCSDRFFYRLNRVRVRSCAVEHSTHVNHCNQFKM